MANGIKFIRVHGRVVPIRDKQAGQKAPRANSANTLTFKFSKQKRSTAARIGGSLAGGIIGAAGGLVGGLALGNFTKNRKLATGLTVFSAISGGLSGAARGSRQYSEKLHLSRGTPKKT